jgi:hypothetical protein
MNSDDILREQLMYLLGGGGAHVAVGKVINDFPEELRGRKTDGAPHTAWQLLEHMRIAQWDILEFCRDGNHQSPKWPEGYWPKTDTPANAAAWTDSVKSFTKDLDAMRRLVENRSTDLYAKIPHGDGQTILREAFLVADHNAYHLGQLVLIRRMLGAWTES